MLATVRSVTLPDLIEVTRLVEHSNKISVDGLNDH